MRMIMPSHAKQVIRYDDSTPLFARYQVEGYLGSMFNPVVQLKSGGYIVIGVTEALVAIDVNSGRATKEGSIEDTALKTNLEACDEVARQLRLRDLAGLIVIDFIDMEERRNNAAVEKRLKDKLKTDRARIQVGRISGFGLMEMSRQRLRPGMLESTTQPCPHCHGTGLIRSDDSMALQVLRALEEEGTRKRSKEVLLKAPIGIVNFLFNQKREHIALIEARYGMSVRLEADPTLISPDYAIEKFKTATRVVPETAPVISGHAGLMGAPVDEDEDDIIDEEIVEEVEEETTAAAPAPAAEGDGTQPSRKRRRRRRRRKPGAANGEGSAADQDGDDGDDGEDDGDEPASDTVAAEAVAEVVADAPVAEQPAPEAAPAKRTVTRTRKTAAAKEPAAPKEPAAKPTSRSRKAKAEAVAEVVVSETEGASSAGDAPAEAEPAPKPKATRSRAKAKPVVVDAPVVETVAEPAAEVAAEPTPAPVVAPVAEPFPSDPVLSEPAPAEALLTDPADTPAEEPTVEDGPPKPKKKGWWSLGR
jgi:ribonuclease E